MTRERRKTRPTARPKRVRRLGADRAVPKLADAGGDESITKLVVSLEKLDHLHKGDWSRLLPHKEARLQPHCEPSPIPGTGPLREGYLAGLQAGVYPLIVENNQAVLLMPSESSDRKLAVFRWHLAHRLQGGTESPFFRDGPTGGWNAVIMSGPTSEPFMMPARPGPTSGADGLLFDYQLLCAEREAEPALRRVAERSRAAYEAILELRTALDADGRHQEGELWPALRRALTEPGSALTAKFDRYRDSYQAASEDLAEEGPGAREFWLWALAGVPTGRFWAGWSDRLRAEGSPVEHGPLPAPFAIVWSPAWPMTAMDLAAAAASAYFEQHAEHCPVLAPDRLSLRALDRQARWARSVEGAARAILDSGVVGAIRDLSDGRQDGRGILHAWLVQEGAGLDPPLSSGALARALRKMKLESGRHVQVEDRLRLAAGYWSKQKKKLPDLRKFSREKCVSVAG